MGNMSQEQMRNNFNMMNPEMMKNASSMFANMSDSQIQMYLSQMGMTGMDPQMFRNMCSNISQMDENQLNNMKNMAQANFNNMNTNNNFNHFNNNYNNNTTSTNNSNSNNKLDETIVGQVTKIKEEGNTLFKQNKYEDAIKKYYEAIQEIKTSTDKDKYKSELNELEKQCRLNIANCKLKTKDYDGVINECSIVLENNKCFKAYYRMGLALFHKKKYDKAFRYLDNANAIGNQSEKSAVEPHLKECKEKLDEMKKKEREERRRKEKEKEELEKQKEKEKEKEKKEKKEENNIINEINEIKEEKKENNDNDNINNEVKIDRENDIDIKETKREETKENKLDNLRNIIEKEKEKNKKDDIDIEDDIKIEDTKEPSFSNNINNNNNFNNNFNNFNNNINNIPPKYSQDSINQARNQINNMSDDQINSMIGVMKQMDNQTLKNLMAAQGMNLSDQQIEMMKASLSPDLIKMAQNQNFPNPMVNNNTNNSNNNNNIDINNNAQPPQMPNLNNMDLSQMMDFVKSNPQLLKMLTPQLSKMMGGKNVDPEIMMKSMENILWIFSIPGRIKRFMLSWRGICFIILIIAIFYGIFKR